MPERAAWAVLLLKTLRIVLIVYGVALVGAWLVVPRLLFQPQPASYTSLPGLLRIPVGGDTIAAVWLPNPAARWTILYSHGNAEDLGDDLPLLRELQAAGFAVFAYDYRGYGASTGRPSVRGTGEEIAAAYAHLTRTLGVAPGRVIVHGRSLGGGPAAELASREPVGGLVLESTFTSVLGTSAWGRAFPFDWMRIRRRLQHVRAPVLVIHGTADEVVPFANGRALFAAARPPKQSLWVEGAGHNDLVDVAGARYWTALRHFADSLEPETRE
ncbi:MAG TPA: alpha/beta hydrolase [Longimicrobium sp.]|nr:alpha/beta hydrolase [Longimicrobium sp.]